ncbi:hypothetical protein [Nesterenkonia muleiensis]|uniref:hypothetical protein n=1 Tax=Nesterenkonia muleiensis TaxID=2282648 RepID=UPI00130073D9|nr:hypothetical protein [Nesterenkonia muleiensis]
MSQKQDAQVIKSALDTHLAYLRAAASVHRTAGRALSRHPELPDLLRSRQSPIAVSAAHRARGASFGQRAEFVEQLLDFPVAGLPALGPSDMRTLQVSAHIGAAALPEDVARAITEREVASRLHSAQPVARPSAEQPSVTPPAADPADSAAESSDPAPQRKRRAWHRRSFEDILRGRK